MSGCGGFLKRTFDVVVGGAALLFLAPVFAVIAALVCLDSGLPILFAQKRIGRNLREFSILKFRTMTAGNGPLVTVSGDPRVTRIGNILRATKLDELPQLWNVLVGDMSLVGPRPEVAKYVLLYPERFREILSVRPGITDSASILMRDEERVLSRANNPLAFYADVLLPAKLDLAQAYVREQTFGRDIRILGETLLVCLTRRQTRHDSWELLQKENSL